MQTYKKKYGLVHKHYTHRWGPIFLYSTKPEILRSRKRIFRFFENGDQYLLLSTSMQHCIDTKTTIDLSKLRIEAVADIAQM